MSQVSFADLIARRIPLAAPEAAALTLAVARLMDARRAAGERVRLPDDEWILLSSNGDVSIVDVHGSADVDETAALSALLRRLLRLDERVPSSGHGTVPGGLLIVLARNLGYIHLPATGPVVFRAALERFAAANPAVLAAVFWRAAAARQVRPQRAGAGSGRDAPGPADRRQEGLSRGDLRRAVRDLEREVFELRRRSSGASVRGQHPAAARPTRRRAVAAVAAATFVGVIAVASLAVRGDAPERALYTPADVMLTPAAAIAPAVHTIVPETASVAPDREDPPPPPATLRSRSETRRSASSPPVVLRTKTPAQRSQAPRPTPKKDPLAAHRGGTRGIPFALPPG